MKKILSLLVLSACLLSGAHSAVINWASGGGRGHAFMLSNGVDRVVAGSLIEVGIYATPGDASSTFTLFGTTTMNTPTGTVGGTINASGNSITSALADGNSNFVSKQFAIRVYNAPSASAATQMGIFTSALWVTDGSFNNSGATASFTVGVLAPTLNNVDAIALNPPDTAEKTIAAGSYSEGPITVTTGTNATGSIYTLANIVTVPEPSSMLLLSSLGVLAMRRRR